MIVKKAVITAAGRRQRTLPLQTLIDRDGTEKSVLSILIEEVLAAGIDEIAVVVRPGDEQAYAQVAGDHVRRLVFVHQPEPLGHGHAVYCARGFAGSDAFLHLVGDHLYVSANAQRCAQALVAMAQTQECAISAVQPTRESLLPYYGAVGGRRVSGAVGLYEIDTVIEKPTPTQAEQRLIVPGLRAGYYLCFFGMHVLTPTVMSILDAQIAAGAPADHPERGFTLSAALVELAQREKYLALELAGSRYDVGVKYGLLTAQLALALTGDDREEVLTRLLELLAQRELNR
ncbi:MULTISPECIES: sugar phosphate nucleotidyltransferase [Caldilinea]|jgi:UTP--glucose-1-phosphate uridylyltransferase|uniref:UTP--glucose-1-phosphate uridylyltransferase n=1 Tax=Caldilinea aerophila (strain DSM 14535 / JCM 11387 / NBRC 104270 / STL-6-O1) TaxID=926550 RepID=I0I8A1_CALAS|nr:MULTISPECIES: sugar phosphate nucleotidyltransferase [Caldilinea]MBO9394616.1 UTP--glucose-1-phosphate uridylyltransferase [Caldilinea sp.]BAM01489.1 putative UTP--glucose-1-phosphate uridylyltransferase [Caldilinea aerophila DSM 14535 = NBRC 104270]GIV72828.1 MAG: UTP--glucose-1-phosphate uridylyltransferase [Caldilinea sp.]